MPSITARCGVTLAKPSQPFDSHVTVSSGFVTECMKSWLAQGSWGRQVTLPPRTTILLMSKVSEKRKPQQHTCTHTHLAMWH